MVETNSFRGFFYSPVHLMLSTMCVPSLFIWFKTLLEFRNLRIKIEFKFSKNAELKSVSDSEI